MRGPGRCSLRRTLGALLALWLAVWASPAAVAQGILQGLRDDVRGADDSSSSHRSDDDDDRRHRDYDFQGAGYHDGDHDHFYGYIVFESSKLAFYALTSPLWGPYKALDDDLATYDYFPRFPYDEVPGYMMSDPCRAWDEDATCAADPLRTDRWPSTPRTWAARLRVEYADEFNDIERVSGHLLLSTRSRFGLDTETSYLEESFPRGGQDELWLGDCNFVYRFAQNEFAQFRTGLGFNWLDDPVDTNYGFNFTYGADLFPRRPWVLSATIDWGTLQRAELFRFRTTAGVLVRGVEVYTGYEYLDIDATQMNGLMGGVRIWF
ncbi:MAG: hypothetical protein ABIP48_03150 [Planctomycetota bacterium]